MSLFLGTLEDIPAISIRQPWAWLTVHGPKSIECRAWRTDYRGPIFIHAGKAMTRLEYESAKAFAFLRGGVAEMPAFESLERGGVIGRGILVDCVRRSSSPWFFGQNALVFADVQPVNFVPCDGALKLFKPLPQRAVKPKGRKPRVRRQKSE